MRTRLFYILFIAATSCLITGCRTKHDVGQMTGDTLKTEQAKTESVKTEPAKTEQTETLPAKTEVVKQETADAETAKTVAAVPQGEPHPGFVYVQSLIPDLIVDLRYFTTNNFMGEKADGYEANVAILTKEAAQALAKAAAELREKGYVVKVFDAYRPQCAVDHFVRWSKTDDQRNKQDYYPTFEKTSLFPQYIALKSGHSRGSTIDMTICHRDTKEEVDMGGHFDYFGLPSHPSFTGKYPGGEVTKEHKQRRLKLRELMVRHGFNPYDSEWWHFTLKNEPYPKTYFEFHVK